MNKSDLVNSINEIRRMSCVSNSSGFLRSFSLNSSGDLSSALKRKLPEDSDLDGSASKKESRLGSPLMSPWEFRRLRADLMDAQAQIVRLEDRVDQLHKKNKEAVIFFDQEKSEMRTKLETSRRSVETLEHKLQRMRTREAEARAELIELKRSYDNARIDRDQRLAELETENAQFRERLEELEEGGDSGVEELKQEAERLQHQLALQQLTIDESQEQAESAHARLNVALEDCRDMEHLRLELQKTQNRVQELESERDEWEEARTVATVLQDRVLRLHDLQKELDASREEIANLKLAVQNKVLMEEKLHDLEVRQAAAQGREKEFIALKEKNFDLETELERWGALVLSCCDGETREDLSAYLAELRDRQLSHSLQRNTLQAELDTVNRDLAAAKDDLQAARTAAEQMKTAMERMRTEGQLLRRKVALVTRERDSYRQQLDLFEKDLTVSGMGGKTGAEGGGQQERIQELETMLQEYRDQMTSLENQMALYKSDDVEGRIEGMRKLEMELSAARAEVTKLSQRRDELEVMLEQKVSQGQHIASPTTRVVHFRNNPCAQAEQQQAADITELRKETDRLRARLRLLEAGERLDLTARANADVESGATARVRELEEQLESALLKNTRLKEVFKRTSQDFRDVSYMLLGYRIDLVSNRIYRLTNMYSEDPNDHFMFQLSRSGMMEMLETPYTERLAELVNEHLHENNSIPCFLSAVTLNLHATAAAESAESAASEEEEQDQPSEEEESDEPIEVELSD